MKQLDFDSRVTNLPASKIREVANASLGHRDVLAFWFGESDEPTPAAICEAAIEALRRGETFYSHNLGLPELRHALGAYVGALHPAAASGGRFSEERIAVTSSGVTALMIAMQMLVTAGDEVVVVVPVWPNLPAQPAILGARVRRVALKPGPTGWHLDLDELLTTVTPHTRVLLVNSPNNPTGWALTREEQRAIVAHCRETGTWIVADEVYERIWFGEGPAAPSFLDIAEPQDRLIVAQSFSKAFLMTGWRLGWLVLPAQESSRVGLDTVGKLIEFNYSCAPVFVQRGGLAALQLPAAFVTGMVHRLAECRGLLLSGLAALPDIEVAPPPGAMYAFFRVRRDDSQDTLAFAKRLVAEHGLGLAPGVAFGDEGEGWLRWCFASRDTQRLQVGLQRLAGALGL